MNNDIEELNQWVENNGTEVDYKEILDEQHQRTLDKFPVKDIWSSVSSSVGRSVYDSVWRNSIVSVRNSIFSSVWRNSIISINIPLKRSLEENVK